ncbi:sensor histidine kinase [Natranaerobius trueperi]|uniref:histidine kinase n=1 Tax=Natranaerobius trueperi TaxID=759412 RepID=A0A226C3C4_9FIRM|nr:sensor histidine kinase [Natranaerobius trueperi]OWZ84910.1 histidine kinase [Natranaerobius trueperi]
MNKKKEDKLDITQIDKILEKTIESIEQGKTEIFDIAETARSEYEQLKNELTDIKKQTAELIDEVDNLEKRSHFSRIRLAEVSKNFNTYSEKDIKQAYEQASELRARLTIMKEREQQMKRLRDNTERRLKNLENTVNKAENIMNQMGAIESYLSQGLGGLQETIDELEQRKTTGLRIIRAQEEERRRVAREIHDGPAQSLANMVLRTEYCEKLLDSNNQVDKIRDELIDLKEQVRLNLKDVRKIIFDLRPMTLDDLGLVPAIRRLIQGVEEDINIEGELKVFGEEARLERDLEIALFRTIQEALNNIKKHSKAKRFWVKVEFREDLIQMNIRDDGTGFEINEVSKDNQFGLSNMKERVTSLEGDIKINSKPKEGTIISIKVPISGM